MTPTASSGPKPLLGRQRAEGRSVREAGSVRVVEKVEVQGAFGSLNRLMAPKMRRDIAQSLANLERRCPSGMPRARPREIGGPRETG